MGRDRRRMHARTVAGSLLAILALTGCGDRVSGRVGVGLNDARQPVILVLSCGSPLDLVIASSSPTAEQQPETGAELGRWIRTSPTDGLSILTPADPGDGWEGPGMSWPPDQRVNIDTGQTAGSVAGMSVVVEAGALTTLSPDDVLVSDAGETLSRTAFEAGCD
mgnify:CR=1 FL=1